MAKLYFKYGVMGSSKSANALMTRFNYLERGCEVLMIKPAIDTRDYEVDEDGIKHAVVRSRIGLSAPVDVVDKNDSILDLLKKKNVEQNVSAIVVDEAQFMSISQIGELKYIAEVLDIAVICYGLLTDFKTNLFPGSKRLIELANETEHMRHICRCGRGAQVNARMDEFGNIITEGAQVDIGGNEKYESMCWRCWRNKVDAQMEVKF
jgi:thymidine kinase